MYDNSKWSYYLRLRELSQTRLALGSDIKIAIITDMSHADAERLFGMLWKQVYLFEKRFSRFLSKSELSIFNRTAGTKTQISSDFRDLLLSARRQGVETGGLYNPFITPALQRAGYIKSAMPGYEQDGQSDYTDRKVVGIERLIIGDDWATIPYGTAIDIGGCGKGYLADQLGQTLNRQSLSGYWMSLGGDVVTKGCDENGNNMTLNVQNANDLSGVSDWIVNCPIEYSSTATSGTFRRKGQNIPKSWHHIIDPNTLEPAITDIRLATICADTALQADVLASCAVILGSKKAPEFLEKHGVQSALLQCIDRDGVPFEKVFGDIIYKDNKDKTMDVLNDV